jgi:hypothetical protein
VGLQQSPKVLHRLLSNFDTTLHSNTRVFLYTGWDGMGWDGMGWDGMRWDRTGRDGMGRYGMGRDGMGLSHSNAWPGTASTRIKMIIKVFGLCSAYQ